MLRPGGAARRAGDPRARIPRSMIPGLKRRVEEAIAEACRTLWGVAPPRVVLETPPKVELGDVAIPVAF